MLFYRGHQRDSAIQEALPSIDRRGHPREGRVCP